LEEERPLGRRLFVAGPSACGIAPLAFNEPHLLMLGHQNRLHFGLLASISLTFTHKNDVTKWIVISHRGATCIQVQSTEAPLSVFDLHVQDEPALYFSVYMY
jgi:hypothetical protein